MKAADAHHGWIDLRPSNMALWQRRLKAIDRGMVEEGLADTSSAQDRAVRDRGENEFFNIGEIAAWILAHEEGGVRHKS